MRVAFTLLIGIPTIIFAIAIFFGSILVRSTMIELKNHTCLWLQSALEDWKFKDGFYYVLGNICGIATPIVSISPGTPIGKALSAPCSISRCRRQSDPVCVRLWTSASLSGACRYQGLSWD